jgi:hypothetical protein
MLTALPPLADRMPAVTLALPALSTVLTGAPRGTDAPSKVRRT